jgi:predicted O-methyltransferase YrrM
MRYLCLFLLAVAHIFGLPAPYSELEEVLPFCDHGWYQNRHQLRRLIKEHAPQTVIEVGCWMGQSTIHIAKRLPPGATLHAIDSWEGSVEHQPGNAAWHPQLPRLYEQFLSNIIHAGLTEVVVPHRLDSLTAAALLPIVADLIYIDAAHDTESVYQDLQAWSLHLAPGGILCGDDWKWPTVRAAVERFAAERGLQIIALGNFYRLY